MPTPTSPGLSFDPISIGLSVGSAAAGLGTGLLGIHSQQQANEINDRYNRQLLEFQRYQYEDMKRYNSITEQVRRMRAAGLNPSLMMQNGTVGSVGSAVGTPSFIPQQPIDTGSISQGISSIAGIASDSISDLAKAGLTVSETIGQDIENSYRDEKEKWNIDNKKALSYMQGTQAEINLQTAKFLQQSMGDRLMQQTWQTEMKRAEAGIQLIASSYAEGQQQVNIYNKLCQAYNAVLTGQASVKQAFAAVKNAITNENNSHALYGLTDADRQDFFYDTLDQLETAADVNESTAFKNQFTPWSSSVGSSLYGSISHNTVEGHQSEYNDYKINRRAERIKRRQNRRKK